MRIKISGFEVWAKNMLLEYKALDPKVKCPDCDGKGEKYCDCCEHTAHCEECDGNGKLRFRHIRDYEFTYPTFLKTVYVDLKKLCVYTGKDFLGAVGEFIKNEQPQDKMDLTSNGKES